MNAESGRKRVPELLAPAGSDEALRAALAAGADAVYFGSSLFSNRMRAKNFAGAALSDAIRLTHAAGAKAHITINTRVRDREMDDALRLADQCLSPADESRADAIIIADMGLAAEILARWPDAVLHASTQTSMGSPADCRALSDLGFRRLVLPRELSREEIARLTGGPLEIEIFLHGAHCVSCSGQCLMSWFCGGRSGNRGECAQPCRLPYTVEPAGKKNSPTPLSLADMCLAGQIPAVIGTGMDSLKIEGRLKPASYVYGVTSVYRRLLDERRAAEPGEIRLLADLFTRGFTDGYFAGTYAPSMVGKEARENPASFPDAKTVKAALNARLRDADQARAARDCREIDLDCVLRRGEPARLTLSCGEQAVTVEGDIPDEATGRPLDRDAILKSLSKLGGTGFALREAAITLDEGLWMPVSRLNDLRRRATDALADAVSAMPPDPPVKRDPAPYQPPKSPRIEEDVVPWTLYVADAALLGSDPAAVRAILAAFSRVTVSAWDVRRAKDALDSLNLDSPPELSASLPVFPLTDEQIHTLFADARGAGCRRIECHTPGQVRAAVDAGFTADLSFRGNVTNAAAADFYRRLGCADVAASPELPCAAVRSMGLSPIVYGRIPVMTLAKCVIQPGNRACVSCGGRDPERHKPFACRGILTDRVGARFPVIGEADCVNAVYNAVPVWMGDRLDQLRGASSLSFQWTDERASEMRDVIEQYQRGESGEGRRIQN
ncbi:MAG: U32 family peptidase [Clostridia bacterium]|nr:U32 family peptidase [Clostridia bacterium]